jgi:hypothetical protein
MAEMSGLVKIGSLAATAKADKAMTSMIDTEDEVTLTLAAERAQRGMALADLESLVDAFARARIEQLLPEIIYLPRHPPPR